MPKSVLFDRDKVIQDITGLFWQKGYNGTSMQDLVEVSGLNRSSIYNTFGDKLNLFETSLKHYQLTQNESMKHTIAKAKSPKEAITMFFHGIRQEAWNNGQKGCLLTSVTMELSENQPHIKDFLIENKTRVVAVFEALIEGAQQLGEISANKDAQSLALFLFTSLQGLRVTSMLESDLIGATDTILSVL